MEAPITDAAPAGPTVLIITMGTAYIAPARMPFELRRAGFRVAMLTPRHALAAHTAFVDQVGYFPEAVKFHEWVRIVVGTVRAVAPVLILPGDDITLRTLMQLVLDPPAELRPEIRNELGELIRRSLGNPAGWIDMIDKSRLFELARRNGIAVAEGDVATNGDVVDRASVAWNGEEMAGFTHGRLETHPGPLGAASVVEFAGIAAVTEATRALFALVNMHGLVGTKFIVDAATRVPYLIEVNRRMLPATHAGARVGIDLAAVLFAAVGGAQWMGPTDLPPGPGLRLALFPQEWHRDFNSPWLRSLASDAPWQDPELLSAMLELRADGNAEEAAPGPTRSPSAGEF